MNFNEIMAKPDVTLETHLIQSYEVGKKLIEGLAFKDYKIQKIKEELLPALLFHDIGKIISDFQQRIKGKKKTDLRHERFSVLICNRFFDFDHIKNFVVLTHHKSIKENNVKEFVDSVINKQNPWKRRFTELQNITDEIEKIIKILIKKTDINLNINMKEKYDVDYLKRFSEKIISELSEEERKKYSLYRSILISADHLASGNNHELTHDFSLDEKIITQNNSFELRSFQKNMYNKKGSYMLLAPTGSGKTEAALCWLKANQKRNTRFFYSLPYTASINAMTERLKEKFENNVTPLHSNVFNYFFELLEKNNEDYNFNSKEARNLKYLSKEIFHRIKVCTPHQILKNSMFGKGWENALSEYKNALFVFDEFHAYDPFFIGLMLSVAKWLKNIFNAKLLFISATIPEFLKEVFIQELGIEFLTLNEKEISDKQILDQTRHKIILKDKSIEDEINDILEISKTRKVLIVVNNVKTCQFLYKKIKELQENIDICLLHGQLTYSDKTKVEKRLQKKDYPNILLSTQCVEVSLDIDYDILFSELAPIDSLIQIFGRLNRKYLKQPCKVIIFKNIKGKTPFYNEEILQNTWNEFLEYNDNILSEKDLNNICSKVYKNGWNEQGDKDFKTGLNNLVIKNYKKDMIPSINLDWIENVIDKNNTIEVIPKNKYIEFSEKMENGEYARASKLMAKVYLNKKIALNSSEYITAKKKFLIINYDYIDGFGFDFEEKVEDLFF